MIYPLDAHSWEDAYWRRTDEVKNLELLVKRWNRENDESIKQIVKLEQERARIRSEIIIIAAKLAIDAWDNSADYLGERMKISALELRNIVLPSKE